VKDRFQAFAFPNATCTATYTKVVPNRVDFYPITVTVSKDSKKIWSGRQQDLFGKNGRPAQAEIIEALKKSGGK
jgi:hypothetical protein